MLIYLIENKINGKGYVGMTTQPLDVRWGQHLCDSKKRPRGFFHKAIRKYGTDAWDMEVLETCATLDELRAAEVRWIEKMGTYGSLGDGYNSTLGGEGNFGMRHSDESKARMSMRRRGEVRGPLPESTRKKIGDAGRGRKHTDETRAKMSAAHAGRKQDPGHSAKIADANRGSKRSDESRKKMSDSAKRRWAKAKEEGR